MNNKRILTHVAGLRGVCIILIILFHILPSVCPSGFIGVDAFFAISGYFLFQKMYRSRNDSFSLRSFLKSKVCRIYPPMLGVLLLCLFIAYLLAPNEILIRTAHTARWAVQGSSNTYLKNMTEGYFATGDTPNFLIHTWYLGVLLQSFLIFGIGAWAFHHYSWLKRHAKPLFFTAFVLLSIVGNAQCLSRFFPDYWDMSSINPSAAYYLTYARLWEVMAGGVLVFIPESTSRTLPEVASLFAVALLCLCSLSSIPSVFVLPLGVIATCVILKYGAGTFVGRFFSSPIPMTIGAASYSLYLFHWPCYLAYYQLACRDLIWYDYLIVGALIAGISYVMYLLLEQRKFPFRMCALGSLLIVGLSWLFPRLALNGLRVLPDAYDVDRSYEAFCLDNYPDYPDELPYWESADNAYPKLHDCPHGDNFKQTVLHVGVPEQEPSFCVMGDSHAFCFYCGIDVVAKELGISGLFLPTYVVPLWNRNYYLSETQFSNESKVTALLAWLQKHKEIKTILLVNRWHVWLGNGLFRSDWRGGKNDAGVNDIVADAECMRLFISKLRNMGKEVVVMMEVPMLDNHVPILAIKQAFMLHKKPNYRNLACTKEEYERTTCNVQRYFSQWEKEGICRVLHAERHLFSRDGVFYAITDGRIMTSDGHHLTQEGSLYWASLLKDDLMQVLFPYDSMEETNQGIPSEADLK